MYFLLDFIREHPDPTPKQLMKAAGNRELIPFIVMYETL
jgi:hypothetical protein